MWNDRGEPEDSEDENLGRRQYASDSDSPDEGTGAPNQGGTIGFASKNTASKGNKGELLETLSTHCLTSPSISAVVLDSRRLLL